MAAVAPSPADLELRKAFAEMQMNKIESTKKLRVLDMQIDSLKKSKQRLIITEHEVSNLPPETKVYASIGRMFALSSAQEMSDELKGKQTKVDTMISQCDTNKSYVVKSLKEQEENLRELVQQKKRDADGAK
uniref:Putative molecular chaperone prefoldin subunit 1 n=1 Tax=Nyssomyia neivai TaxID=330878 RepID=A0A1L8DTX2_9DIPT